MLQIFKKQKQSLKYLHVLLHNRARQRTKQNLLKYISSNRTYHKIGLIYVYSNSQSICNIRYIFYNFVTEIKCLVSDLVAVFLVTTAASGSPEKSYFITFPKQDLTWKSFPAFFLIFIIFLTLPRFFWTPRDSSCQEPPAKISTISTENMNIDIFSIVYYRLYLNIITTYYIHNHAVNLQKFNTHHREANIHCWIILTTCHVREEVISK